MKVPSKKEFDELCARSEREHSDVDAEIRIRMEKLNRTNAHLNAYCWKHYETESRWSDLSLTTKSEIKEMLDGLINLREARRIQTNVNSDDSKAA